jgi:N-carbamoylputrescine amidase
LEKSVQKIRDAASQGAKLIILQELHRTPYFCQTESTDAFDLAESIPGPSTQRLGEIAKERGVVIVASLFEKRAPGLYHNTAVVLEQDGTLAGKYRKMHIPDDPGYYEKYYFTPGDMGFKPIKTSVGSLGILVCWDQWFPEAARAMALAGAEVLIYPTAIGWNPPDAVDEKKRQLEAWQIIQRAHAVANGIPLLSCNRTGFEADPSGVTDGIQFWGNSMIVGQQGELIAQAEADEEVILHGQLNLSHSEQIRRLWPFLRDRRIEHYSILTSLFGDHVD